MAICIPPQGGTVTTKEVPLYNQIGERIGTSLECTATPNPGWTCMGWEWDQESWYDNPGTHTYTLEKRSGNFLPASYTGFSNVDEAARYPRGYYHVRSSNLRAVFYNPNKYYAAVSLSVRGEAARNAGCKVSVSGEPFALDSQSCVVLDSPGEVAFTLAYKESAQFKFSEYQDENGNTVTSPVILTASTSGAIANVYAIFGGGRQILHGASNTILHGRNRTILHLE